jgi:hypothetical protein
VPADAPEAVAAAQVHCQELIRFYDVTAEMHHHLADMYVSDDRFTAYYERLAPGLAQYVHDAVHAAAD